MAFHVFHIRSYVETIGNYLTTPSAEISSYWRNVHKEADPALRKLRQFSLLSESQPVIKFLKEQLLHCFTSTPIVLKEVKEKKMSDSSLATLVEYTSTVLWAGVVLYMPGDRSIVGLPDKKVLCSNSFEFDLQPSGKIENHGVDVVKKDSTPSTSKLNEDLYLSSDTSISVCSEISSTEDFIEVPESKLQNTVPDVQDEFNNRINIGLEIAKKTQEHLTKLAQSVNSPFEGCSQICPHHCLPVLKKHLKFPRGVKRKSSIVDDYIGKKKKRQ